VFNEVGEIIYSAARPTLKQGAKSGLVKELQARLNELGHDCGNPDGSFGPRTLAAVKSLQEERGLTVNGVVDSITWNALYAFEPYKVAINTGALRVRLGPGTSYATRTTVSRNSVFTITYEKDNWGRLKSHAGWISLKYTKKVES
jgi:peptidoglycan hydrolase-like protein with peptidoglycan-binding domain